MNYKFIVLKFYFILFSQMLFSNELYEKSLEELFFVETELKANIGSRSGSREFLYSNVPIKIITNKEIKNSGLKKLTQVLQYFIAGFNSPSPAINDGSDHVSIGTLRGLNPDQVLVLVNGKRLHTSALIHLNNTIGKGSSGVDFNTIPVVMIEHIEILSDGAAAQYGSDAIAGVINIILKTNGHQNSVSSKIGTNLDGGGNTVQGDMFHSTSLDYDGYLNIAASIKTRQRTNHEREGKKTPLGQAKSQDFTLALNILSPQENDINIYADALFNYRDSINNAYYRDANSDRNNITIYPNGFLPKINAKIYDASLTLGVNGDLSNNTSWDLSQKLGYNSLHYYVLDSLNNSMGLSSPTSFDSGGLSFLQATTNFDMRHKFSSFNIAGGLEFRYENFAIKAGDLASHKNGKYSNNAGAQGFPGFQAKNVVDAKRHNIAAYLQIDKKMNAFSFELATRFENYSDFGSTNDYKLSLSYRAKDSLLLRASTSTGFHAPSLSQSQFSTTGTSIFKDTLTQTDTLRTSNPIAISLGAKELKAEKSLHFTSGFVYKLQDNFSLSTDYFYIKINDRIMISDEIPYTENSIVRFFTNAVNTKTQGIDVAIKYETKLQNNANLNFNASYSYSKTKILSFNDTRMGLSDSIEEKNRIENAQPQDYIKLYLNYELHPINVALNISKYGDFFDIYSLKVQNFSAQWSADLDISYQVSKQTSFAIGGTNILDSYPEKNLSTKRPLYSQYSPFGYNGAYYYIRASYEF